MVDFRRKLQEQWAARNPDNKIPAPMERETPKIDVPEPKPSRMFKIIVRVTDASDAPPEVSYEITGYIVTNITEKNYILRKIGEDVRGVTNVTKDKVGDFRPVIRRNIAVGDSGQIWASAETWVFGNVDMYVDMVKNDIAHALTYFRTRAQRIIDHIESEE